MKHYLLIALFLAACGTEPAGPDNPDSAPDWDESANIFTMAVVGDYGVASEAEGAVADLIRSWDPDMVLTVGDNIYIADDPLATFERNVGAYYGDFISPSLDGNKFWPCMGNHDWEGDTAPEYIQFFNLPGNERYYTFRKGDVQLFAVNSDTHEPDGTSKTSKQAMWLKNELAKSTAKWKIVYFHHPPYATGCHTSSTYMRWPFKQWGADVVISGHDHSYGRRIQDGFPYFVSGLGGHRRCPSLYLQDLPDDEIPQARYLDNWGALKITVHPNALNFEFITIDREVIDQYMVAKETPNV